MIKIFVNGEGVEVENTIGLADFLELQKLEIIRGYALAVNDIIVPKSMYSTHILESNDRILIIKATAGG